MESPLTARQVGVLQALACGLTLRAAAARVGVSEDTAARDLRAAAVALLPGVGPVTVVPLLLRAVHLGIIRPPSRQAIRLASSGPRPASVEDITRRSVGLLPKAKRETPPPSISDTVRAGLGLAPKPRGRQ